MAQPTIIIGIGSSGLFALEQVQRFHYEAFRTNKPKHVEYLYIETNKDNRVGVTPLQNEIGRVYISLAQMGTMIRNLKQGNENAWLPEPNALLNAGLGAGGIRACGRLALWGKNDEGNNFTNVIRAIQNAYARAVKDAYVQKPTVFIVGSSTGGTGSGIFIDIAYLVRHLIEDIKELFALLLIPNKPVNIRNFEVMYGNTYSLIKDISHFNEENTVYREKWPNGKNYETTKPPYELVQFMSQDYNDGSPAINTLTGLYKMAGMYLFLNIVGMREKRMERLLDAAGAMHVKHYNTFGMSAIQFPKDQIQEYLAAKMSIKLLERWIDPQSYYQNNSKYPINRAEIKEQTIERWNEMLEDAFAIMDSTGNNEIMYRIEEEVELVNKNQQSGNAARYVRDLFTSKKSDNLYGILRFNVQTAVDKLVEEIHDWFVESLNRTESLTYAREMLLALLETIGDTLKFWSQTLKINSETSQWEKRLATQTNYMLKSGFLLARHKEIGEQNRVLLDRMVATTTLMKMHLLFDKLAEIGKNMKREDVEKKSTRDTSKRLPRLRELDEMVTHIRSTIGKDIAQEGGSDANEISLYKRLSLIIADINDDSVPILRVYKAESFEKEIEISESKIAKEIPSKTVLIGGDDLWSYLSSLGYNFINILYKDSIQKYREKILEMDIVPDYDVSEYIKRRPEEGKRMATRALAGFISVGNDKIFDRSPYLPRFVVGEDQTKITEIINLLQHKENFSEFSTNNDGILELPDMKNIMVFFDEKGTINPLTDISYIDQMQETYENFPSHVHGMTAQKWKRDRDAYGNSSNGTTASPTVEPVDPSNSTS
ncbi:MAG: tubulin-like doman-containing protein [Bacteroidota bacterium]